MSKTPFVQLNLPLREEFSACKSLLLAGMGGGFDVFCAIPLYLSLKAQGVNVHLGSLSFAPIEHVRGVEKLSENLFGVTAAYKTPLPYFPEGRLVRWFAEEQNEDVTVWCLRGIGGATITDAYTQLATHLQLDGVLLVDGGVDGILRGDEQGLGTILEDAYSLAAVAALTNLPHRWLMCVGFGSETEVNHQEIFANIADLTKRGGFRGVCAFANGIPECDAYEKAVTYAHAYPRQDPSVVNASILSAMHGEFGDFHLTEKTKGSKLAISPLMTLCWFFDLMTVADASVLLPALRHTRTFQESLMAVAQCKKR
jgi:hypothetical protein